jgi:pre-mRNA-splicing factor CDC5/CEF1
MRGKERRNRGIDYSAEVAFERKPAPGFYDTGEEAARTRNLQQVRGCGEQGCERTEEQGMLRAGEH